MLSNYSLQTFPQLHWPNASSACSTQLCPWNFFCLSWSLTGTLFIGSVVYLWIPDAGNRYQKSPVVSCLLVNFSGTCGWSLLKTVPDQIKTSKVPKSCMLSGGLLVTQIQKYLVNLRFSSTTYRRHTKDVERQLTKTMEYKQRRSNQPMGPFSLQLNLWKTFIFCSNVPIFISPSIHPHNFVSLPHTVKYFP